MLSKIFNMELADCRLMEPCLDIAGSFVSQSSVISGMQATAYNAHKTLTKINYTCFVFGNTDHKGLLGEQL